MQNGTPTCYKNTKSAQNEVVMRIENIMESYVLIAQIKLVWA